MSLNNLQTYGEETLHRQLIAETVNKLMQGRANNASTFTLRNGETTTTVVDTAFESSMVPCWTPLTANAAAALTNIYLSDRDKGSFTVTHADPGSTDCEFAYIRWG